MPDFDPTKISNLDSEGEKLWGFGLKYQLPELPDDNRDWFNAVAVVDETLHDDAFGSAWTREHTMTILVREHGVFSAALEKAKNRASNALTIGSLAASILVEIQYSDPSIPVDKDEIPF